jgi:site-specific DNA recombinase
MAKDRYGCSSHRSKGLCTNGRTISRQEIEDRILKAIKHNLVTPELVAEFTRAYQEEVNRLVAEASLDDAQTGTKLACAQRTIDRIMRAIEDGLYQPTMKTRLAELEAEKTALTARQRLPRPNPKISIHPNLGAVYRREVEELESLLSEGDERDEAMELIRSLIERITLTPRSKGPGSDALLSGDLARILMLCTLGSTGARQ